MSANFQIGSVKNVIYVSSDISQSCPLCRQMLKAEEVGDSINHILQAHDYKLLHVGTETTDGSDGKPWHKTVAVLGQ